MNEFIPAIVVMLIGTPLCFLFYHWYVARWYRKHGRAEDVIGSIYYEAAHYEEEGEYYREQGGDHE